MDKFVTHRGTVLPLRRSDVDTDQILPAEYLKRITRTGFEDALFRAWREDPAFALNDPVFAGASILVAGHNFGTGSSRQHAVWALRDWGFRVVVSPRFGDIFRGNALKEGLLPVQLDQSAVETLWDLAPDTLVDVDLAAREVRADGFAWTFPIDDFTRWRLMDGLDDIGLTLRHEDAIAAYENDRAAFKPSTKGF
ncbi:3-isopropylmalate dehydratase small subunit [Actinoplanes sp. TBRC 11911]|uniref:3-isopropylmalate dehydratase small subunit n=1 Tax=Actinoplanes sp. TBRC 11911 TaxID=2729386 RepID=UPI00145D2ED8|nr:3-isopropylmalate dehydratase small subunit [Actinoplanes sp. TBRC 11911]NMO56846.1 3-isopropylmalate dehydratase small subunit [Actinoplanes sp. TBRC 11911]